MQEVQFRYNDIKTWSNWDNVKNLARSDECVTEFKLLLEISKYYYFILHNRQETKYILFKTIHQCTDKIIRKKLISLLAEVLIDKRELASLFAVLQAEEQTVRILSLYGLIYVYKSEYDKANEYFSKAIALSDINENNEGNENDEKEDDEKIYDLCNVYYNMSLMYHNQLKGEDEITCLSKALILGLRLTKKSGYAYYLLGRAYESRGDIKKAIDCYKNGLFTSKINCGENHPTVADYYHNLGVLYQQIKNWSSADEYYNESLRIRTELNLVDKMIETYYNLGLMYYDIDETDKSIDNMLKIVELVEHLPEPHKLEHLTYDLLAGLYIRQDNYEEAEKYCKQLLTLRSKYGDSPVMLSVYNNLRLIYKKLGKSKEEQEMFRKWAECKLNQQDNNYERLYGY